LPAQVEAILAPMAQSGAQDALAQLDVRGGVDFDVVNEHAVAWAKDRSAELVGMKYVDGELVENPKAEWSIEESTRETIRDLVDARPRKRAGAWTSSPTRSRRTRHSATSAP
jgi:hypothetical protein